MDIKVIVFDFDGTLIQSNQLKYEAFFELFPKKSREQEVVTQVLSEIGEASRYSIVARILRELGEPEVQVPIRLKSLVHHYNELVTEGAKTCSQMPGAEETLRTLSLKATLYLSSTTPEESLRDIVAFRGWTRYFQHIFGYPRRKPETLRWILEQEQIKPQQLLVVGDGDSDREAAQAANVKFFDVKSQHLSSLLKQAEELW